MSLMAQLAVTKIQEKVRKGEKVSVSAIMRDVGYSKYSAQKLKLKETEAWRDLNRPILEGLDREINEIKNAMALKDKSQEEYRALAYALDVVTKNHQLLSPASNQKTKIVIDEDKKSKLLAILNDNA